MIRVMGGASGIIFGLLFYAGSKNIPPKTELTTGDFVEIFSKALTEIQAKGGAKPGDKSSIDSLEPAVNAMQSSVASGAGYKEVLASALAGAETGKEKRAKNILPILVKQKHWASEPLVILMQVALR